MLPVWTEDESALLMTRVIARLSIVAPQRAELWRVAREDGAARRLMSDPTFSIVSWADCADRSRVNCVAGPKGEVLALVRTQGKRDDSANTLAYARIDATTGSIEILRETNEFAGSDFRAARTTGDDGQC